MGKRNTIFFLSFILPIYILFWRLLFQITTNVAAESNTQFFSYSYRVQKSKISITRLKVRCGQCWFLLPSIGENSFFPSSLSHGRPHSLPLNPPWIVPAFCFHPHPLFLLGPPCLLLISTLWSHWVHLDGPRASPHLKNTSLITSSNPLP